MKNTVLAAALLAVLTGCPYKTIITTQGQGEDAIQVQRTEMDATNLMRAVDHYAQTMADLQAELRDPATTEEQRVEVLDLINAYQNGINHAIQTAIIQVRAVLVANGDRVVLEAKGNKLMLSLEQEETQ